MIHLRLRTAYTRIYRLNTSVCGVEPGLLALTDDPTQTDCPKCRHAVDVLGYRHDRTTTSTNRSNQ